MADKKINFNIIGGNGTPDSNNEKELTAEGAKADQELQAAFSMTDNDTYSSPNPTPNNMQQSYQQNANQLNSQTSINNLQNNFNRQQSQSFMNNNQQRINQPNQNNSFNQQATNNAQNNSANMQQPVTSQQNFGNNTQPNQTQNSIPQNNQFQNLGTPNQQGNNQNQQNSFNNNQKMNRPNPNNGIVGMPQQNNMRQGQMQNMSQQMGQPNQQQNSFNGNNQISRPINQNSNTPNVITNQKSKKKSKKKLGVFIGTGIVAVLLICIAVFGVTTGTFDDMINGKNSANNVNKYLNSATEITTKMDDAVEKFTETDKKNISDAKSLQQALSTFEEQAQIVEQGNKDLKELDPPDQYKDAHNDVVAASETLASAMKSYTDLLHNIISGDVTSKGKVADVILKINSAVERYKEKAKNLESAYSKSNGASKSNGKSA